MVLVIAIQHYIGSYFNANLASGLIPLVLGNLTLLTNNIKLPILRMDNDGK